MPPASPAEACFGRRGVRPALRFFHTSATLVARGTSQREWNRGAVCAGCCGTCPCGSAAPSCGKALPFPGVSTFSAREAGVRVWPRVEPFLRNPGNTVREKRARESGDRRAYLRDCLSAASRALFSLTAFPGFRKIRSTLGHTLAPASRAEKVETPVARLRLALVVKSPAPLPQATEPLLRRRAGRARSSDLSR